MKDWRKPNLNSLDVTCTREEPAKDKAGFDGWDPDVPSLPNNFVDPPVPESN